MGRFYGRKRRFRRKLGRYLIVILVFLVVVVTPLSLYLTDSFGVATSLGRLFAGSSLDFFDSKQMRVIDGDYTIDAPGERLENMRIGGNLYLSAGIGDGSVELVNVIVEGALLVQGGGMNTIYMQDSHFEEVKVNRPGGRVRLVASGETYAPEAVIESGARLIEELTGDGAGFERIEVVTAERVELAGNFEVVQAGVPETFIDIEGQSLGRLGVERSAENAIIGCPDGMLINRLNLEGSASLAGRPVVAQAVFAAPGVSELGGDYSQVRVTAVAGQFNLLESSRYDEMIVVKGALNNVLNLEQTAVISYLELNEAVTVTGGGTIKKVRVNAGGSTFEQVPLEIEFGKDVTVIVAGREISSPEMLKALLENSFEDDEEPGEDAPGEDEEGEETEEEATDEEEVAVEEGLYLEPDHGADWNDHGVSGPVPAPDPAPQPAPPAPTEPEPNMVRDFRVSVEGGLTPGKKLVVVILNVPDPRSYTVTVGGVKLDYREAIDGFRGEVKAADAVRENLVINR